MQGWQKLETTLPVAINGVATAQYGNWVYVMGGATELNFPFSTFNYKIFKAKITQDGRMGPFSVLTEINIPKLGPTMNITPDGDFWILGGTGFNTTVSPAILDNGREVYYSKVDGDGNLVGGPFKLVGSIPHCTVLGQSVIDNGYIYQFGGINIYFEIDYSSFNSPNEFISGETLTGQTTGDTANILEVTDFGSNGFLKIGSPTGPFISGEELIGSIQGKGTATSGISDTFIDVGPSSFVPGNWIYDENTRAYAYVVNNDGNALQLNQRVGTFASGHDVHATFGRADCSIPLNRRITYDMQTSGYTVGDVLTGGTSGATGVIAEDQNSGITGLLILTNVVGAFINGETITDAHGGSAIVDGIDAYEYINFNNQQETFVPGNTLVGITSGATASLDDWNGGLGILQVSSVVGTFVVGETVLAFGPALATTTSDQYFFIYYNNQPSFNFAIGDMLTNTDTGATGTVIYAEAFSGGNGRVLCQTYTEPWNNGDHFGAPWGATAQVSSVGAGVGFAYPIFRAALGPKEIGPWEVVGYYPPEVLSLGSTLIKDGVLYISSEHKVFWADFRGGQIATWNFSELPGSTINGGLCIDGNKILRVGGEAPGGDPVNDVWVCSLGSNGELLGDWFKTADLPDRLSRFGFIQDNGFIYTIGGRNLTTSLDSVYRAKVVNGLIGGQKNNRP